MSAKSNLELFKDEFEKEVLSEKKGPYYAVMLFDTQVNLGTGDKPNVWVNYKNVYFNKGSDALMYYANTRCPASQLIDADTEYELKAKIGEMILNYMNEEWLNENLYPYM